VTGFAIKFSPTGQLTWNKTFGATQAYNGILFDSSAAFDPASVAVDGGGNVYLCGNFSSNMVTPPWNAIGRPDAFALKLDSSGNTLWFKHFGGITGVKGPGYYGANTQCSGIAPDNLGNIYLAGWFHLSDLTVPPLAQIPGTEAKFQNALLIRLDTSGNVTGAKNYGGSGAAATFNSVSVDGGGNVYLGGEFGSNSLTIPPLTKIGPSSSYDSLLFKLGSSGQATSYSLTARTAGTGAGTITSNPAGINCGSTCSFAFSGGSSVTLTATAASGSTFVGWSGACTGTGTCTLTMDAAKSAMANFTLPTTLKLTSPAFIEGGLIPTPFTYNLSGQCSGSNWSPPLQITNPPKGTQSYALIVRDPDGGNFLHWKAWNIAATTVQLPTNATSLNRFSQGTNGFGSSGYGGPCPPSGTHRYIFTLYSLNTTFASEPSETQLAAAALQTATLTGNRTPTTNLAWQSKQQALFVNASTSTNKTSVVRVINTSNLAGALTATAYNESGVLLGSANASLGSFAAYQTRSFTSAQLELALGFTPSAPTSKYSVFFATNLPDFEIINYTKDNATCALTLSQALEEDRSSNPDATSSTRASWFLSASTSTNKTNVLRLMNTSGQSGTLSAFARDESGNAIGTSATTGAYTNLGAFAPYQMRSFTSAEIENALGFTPSAPSAKYRVWFNASVATFELINFTKDTATGNLTLVQTQLEDRPAPTTATVSRHILVVYPSTHPTFINMVRLVNPYDTQATLSATAYDETRGVVGTGTLGTVGPNQILALTSAQIETALGYVPSAATAKYRLVVTASVPSFEVLNNIRVIATNNLYLAQAQNNNAKQGAIAPTTRGVHIIYPASGSTITTQLLVTNTSTGSGSLTATAYDEAGTVIASNRTLGTLGANQMLTFTSAQLQSLMGYTPSAGATWRMMLSANLDNFEVINYAVDSVSGIPVLAQQQIE
jgi:Raf kinase inhibitor-like YbhB/YbcL family protein